MALDLNSIVLRVAHLARSVEFYTQRLGFVAIRQTAGQAELAAAPNSPVLLTLLDAPAAPAAPRDAAGLFHSALLFPSRAALGGWWRFAAENRVDFDGFSDHGVSEAIYLSDPDGNGLEFYADRPRDTWPFAANGEVAMTTLALDVPSLLAAATLPAQQPVLAGAHWGHLHLRVSDLGVSESFYRKHLSMVVTQSTYPGARFLAADGYHHHLGLNTWGEPRRPQPSNALGLAEATFVGSQRLHDAHLADPDGIRLQLLAARPEGGNN